MDEPVLIKASRYTRRYALLGFGFIVATLIVTLISIQVALSTETHVSLFFYAGPIGLPVGTLLSFIGVFFIGEIQDRKRFYAWLDESYPGKFDEQTRKALWSQDSATTADGETFKAEMFGPFRRNLSIKRVEEVTPVPTSS